MNIQKLIDSGFSQYDIKDFDQKNGWCGLTTYHPGVCFRLNKKSVVLQLVNDKQRNVIFISNAIEIYRNERGIFPDDNFIERFIKTA